MSFTKGSASSSLSEKQCRRINTFDEEIMNNSTPKNHIDCDKYIYKIAHQHQCDSESTPSLRFNLAHDSLQLSSSIDEFSTRLEGGDDNEIKDHLGSIEVNVNEALTELSSTYKLIGYTPHQIAAKKAEIFTLIQDTITYFAGNLQRERTNIENECEWLRQQIQIILAMINDVRGDKLLTLRQKGLAFDNEQQYTDGYKEEVLSKMSSPNFILENEGDALLLESQYESITRSIPELTLIEKRYQLNNIFFNVLKVFVCKFQKFNLLNLKYATLINILGKANNNSNNNNNNNNSNDCSFLPAIEEAEIHRQVITEFEQLVKMADPMKTAELQHASQFSLASPTKEKKKKKQNSDYNKLEEEANESGLDRLRELNYQLVRIIRGLKITKINTDLIQIIENTIEVLEQEFEERKRCMRQTASKCLQYIEFLQFKDEQLSDLQNPQSGMQLDSMILHSITENPQNFGMLPQHVDHLNKVHLALKQKIDQKKEQWSQYSEKCKQLWLRLGESNEYMEEFMTRNDNLSDLAILNFKMELNRLFIKRSEHIERFISETRAEIEQAWDKLFYSQEMRMEFRYYNNDAELGVSDKDVILNAHEEELHMLNKEYADKAKIFKLYDELLDLLKDQKFLQESSKDSSRLLSKNSCKILLNEERLRKRINKSMPNILASLKDEVTAYNRTASSEGKRPVLFNGKSFLEEIKRIETEQMNSGMKFRPKTSGSPTKLGAGAASRVQPEGTIASNFLKTTSNGRAKINKSPTTSRPSSSNRTLPTTMRNSSAHFNTFTINSSSASLFSPMRASRNNSQTGMTIFNELQPLRSPLKPRTNLNSTSPTNKNSQSKKAQEQQAEPFRFAPIPIQTSFLDQNHLERVDNVSNNDTSTLIGDDYVNWRDEKIRQLNEM
ncbi:ASE1 [Candida oxycetoniae]|uniref:ASE1 n=1 Tax=Candida oxycetoniae TaxID=497107 RepID=A0AAI9SY49_9ASCO|nr:ASE1 [Candida oxycetoniae]KAI3405292.2 ASE1 [Candida oxycetoniae]